MSSLKLYGKSACHLCDLAKEQITLAAFTDVIIEYVDIEQDHDLMNRYGEHIPVVLLPNGQTVFWPFDSVQLRLRYDQI